MRARLIYKIGEEGVQEDVRYNRGTIGNVKLGDVVTLGYNVLQSMDSHEDFAVNVDPLECVASADKSSGGNEGLMYSGCVVEGRFAS